MSSNVVIPVREKIIDLSDRFYDFDDSVEDNLSKGKKYIVLKVDQYTFPRVQDPKKLILPNTRYLTNFESLEMSSATFEAMLVDTYSETPHGVVVVNFNNYNSKFFSCDERVFFEALIVKHRSFKKKEFFFTQPDTLQELGIKRERRSAIIKKFKSLGIIETRNAKAVINGNTVDVTYFKVKIDKILELVPQIYNVDEDTIFRHQCYIEDLYK